MLNLLPLTIGIIAIFAISRYNKSNKLFWTLLMSMLFGFVCGSISTRHKTDTKKDDTTKVSLMHKSSAFTVQNVTVNDATLLKETQADKANYAGMNILYCDVVCPSEEPTKYTIDKFIGPGVQIDYINTS